MVLGRNPTNQVAFDPEKDAVVSGRHAELTFDGNAWKLVDLGSSNGTWHEGAKITQRVLMPGDVIQFGKNGPKLRFDFAGPAIPATMVLPVNEPAAPPEGRTVMMMMNPDAVAAASAPIGAAPAAMVAPPRKKKGGMLRALLIIGAVLMLLVVGLAVLAIGARRSNMKKKAAVAAAAKAQQQETQKQAEQLKVQIAQKEQEVARTLSSIDQVNQQTPSSSTAVAGGTQAEDLARQLSDSQRLIEEMTRQLQEKNDALAAAQKKPAAPEVRYVPAPAPRTTPPTRAATPAPATNTPAVTTAQPATQPVPLTPAASRTAQAPPPATPPSGVTPTGPLSKSKRLKTKIMVTALPPEIPPANMPTGAVSEVAKALSTALVSSGEYVIGQKGQASVSVMITNYKSEVSGNVDVKKTVDSARRIGGLFGTKLPQTPGDVKSSAYDSAMSVRVALYDGNGRTLLQTEPSAASASRKSKVSLAGVPFNQVVLSDTPTGDVARKVVGDAVEQILTKVTALDWTTTVSGQRPDGLSLAVGRSGNVEVGDVFEVADSKKTYGRVRVTSVTEASADAELLFNAGKERLSGKMLRYVGSEGPSAVSSGNRSVTIRSKTSAFDGPGNSFNKVKELKPGQRFQLFFSVGSWGRVSDGSTRFWVPLSFAEIKS